MTSTLFRGGVVHSSADPFAEALLIEDGIITWIGPDDSAAGFATRADHVVDLDGLLVTPAFVDAHVNLLATGHDIEGSRPEPAITPERHRYLTDLALNTVASRGIVCVHEMANPARDTPEQLADLIARTSESTSGKPLVVGYWGELCTHEGRAGELAGQIPGLTGVGGDLAVDGTFGTHTAALKDPYTDLPSPGAPLRRGILELDAQQIATHVISATTAGLPAALHVMGDRALHEVLTGFELAAQQLGVARIRTIGHRLEHAPMLNEEALAELVRFGINLSVQPAFDAHWGGPEGMFEARLGNKRAQALLPLADIAAAGVPLAFGSNSPVTPVNPWQAVRSALLLSSTDQRITARAAFRAHTRGGWRIAGHKYATAGEIRLGSPAHLAFWRADALAVQGPDRMFSAWSADARAGIPLLPDLLEGSSDPVCVRTMRDGNVIFERDSR